MANDDELIGTAEASEIIGISVATFTRWVKNGTVTATKLPGLTGSYVVTRAETERIRAAKAAIDRAKAELAAAS